MWKRRVIIGLLLGFTLLLAVVVLLQTNTFQQWILRNAENFARAAGFPFSARNVDINWWDLEVSLDDFVYDDEKGTRITADRVLVDIPWNAFDSEIIVINDLEAQGLAIEIRSPEPVVPEPSGEPIRLPRARFGRILVTDARFSYSNQSTTVDIPSFAIDLREGRGALRMASSVTVTPDTRFEMAEIPLEMGDAGLNFGPAPWGFSYSDLAARGRASGAVTWSPSLALSLDYSTDPFTFQQFNDIQSAANITFENGILKISDFQATKGDGQILASAEISDQAKTVMVLWSKMNLAPVGFSGVIDGKLDLNWTASDLSDASGQGDVTLTSRDYGTARSGILIKDGRATLDLVASAYDATLRASLNTGLDQKVEGSFLASHRKYGLVDLRGRLGGTITDPTANAVLTVRNATYNGIGPADASANATLRSMIISLTDVQATYKNSKAEQGFVRVDLNSERLAGEIPVIRLQMEDFAPDTKGTSELAATINGTIRKPLVRLTGASPGMDIGGTHIDQIGLQAELDGDDFRLNSLTATQGSGQLQAAGSVNLSSEAVSGHLRVSNLDIQQVRDLSTTASLEADVQGTYRTPSVNFTADLQNLTYQNQSHGNIHITGTTNTDTLSVDVQSDHYTAAARADVELHEPYPFRAVLTADQSQLTYEQYEATADGTAKLSGKLQPFEAKEIGFEEFRVSGEGVNVAINGDLTAGANVDASADLSQLPVEGVQLGGNARIAAVVRGTIENPLIEGRVETANATVQTPGMMEPAAIEAAVNFTRDEFVIESLRSNFAEATATITGRGTLKGTGSLQFRAENIRPERFVKDGALTGVLGIEGSLEASGPAIDAISGSARVTQLDLKVRDIPIRQVSPIEVAVENQVFTVRSFELEGLNTRTSITGNANLRTNDLNFAVSGNTEVRIIEAIIPGSVASGQIRTNISVKGRPDQPDLQGFLGVENLDFEMIDPPVMMADTNAEVRFSGERLEIVGARGTINGGQFEATGGSEITFAGLQNAEVEFSLTNAQIEYPEGLQSEVSSRLLLEGTLPNLALSGDVDILNAIYRRDIDLAEEVFTRITTDTASQGGGGAAAAQSLLDQVRLDVNVGTTGLVSVVNNVASLDLTGDFQVRGTLANPVILGRATALEGGELYFGPSVGDTGTAISTERRDRYIIEQGAVDFNNPIVTEPNFDFVATHELRTKGDRILIRLQVSGTPQDLKTELSSDPAHSEEDIVAMLLTGRTFADLQGAHLDVAREQAFNYISGQLGGFFQNAGSTLGLDTVRIEPIMLAEEEDVSARLTIGKDITQDFNLVYSQNLSGAKDQSWILTYQTFRNLMIRGINESANNRTRGEIRQELRFGGGPALPERVQPRNESVMGMPTFEGATIPMKDLLERVTEPGDPFNAYRMNEDLRELKQFYADRGFLGARIRAERNPRNGEIDVRFLIEEGPQIQLIYEGSDIPRRVRNEIRNIWMNGFSEAASLRDTDNRLLRHFRDEGYLQTTVTQRNGASAPDTRQFIFHIERGPHFDDPEWVFNGIEPMDILEPAGTILENPTAIKDRIEFNLRREGYLDATATVPELVLDGRRSRFQVAVERGPLYSIGNVTFMGNESLQQEVLRTAVSNASGDTEAFTSSWLDSARRRVIGAYWENGFNDVQVVPQTRNDREVTVVHVTFNVTEGEQQKVESIRINGNETTDPDFIARKFTFKEGDPVDYSRINLTRKQLYDTRLFKRADIEIVRGQNGYVADVNLNESAPWRLRYGFAVANRRQTTDRDLGITADFSYGNLLGKGILLGTSGKVTVSERDIRAFASFPVFMNRDVTTSATLYRTRDLSNELFTADLWGFTLQQQWRLKNFYILSYDYGFEYNHSYVPGYDPDNPFDYNVTSRVARFSGTLSRDSRDDILNATRGTFFSTSTEIAPPGVGSRLTFIKNYSQYVRFDRLKDRFVWASAVRGGLGRGFGGQDLTPDDQFTAGGPTSVRGFKQDQLSFLPGNAVFLFNQEIRFPIFWRFGGVGFFDAGNVYPVVRDFNPFKLRYSPGVGLRLDTPFALIRVDLGFNPWPSNTGLDPEPKRHFSFGIGQAF